MTDIRRHRVLVCFVAAFVLLSFFFAEASSSMTEQFAGAEDANSENYSLTMEEKCEVREQNHIGTGYAGNLKGNGFRAAVLASAPDEGIPAGSASISLAGMVLEEIATKDQQTTRTLLARSLIVIFLFIPGAATASRTAIRRFSGRMIPVWENIYYIHQMDGKKESAFLYT